MRGLKITLKKSWVAEEWARLTARRRAVSLSLGPLRGSVAKLSLRQICLPLP